MPLKQEKANTMSSQEKPNILFILADDLGWGDVGYHGSPIRTPSIDRMVENGVELDYHYVCPMCTPTRVTLLTGRHPGRFGTHATVPSNPPVLPDGYTTLAGAVKSRGYRTGLFGKWHLGSDKEFGPNHYGFDYSYGSLAGGVDPYNHRYKKEYEQWTHTWHRNEELVKETGHVTDLIAAEACAWIETNPEPWFCYVPFTAVHVPVKAPQRWLNTYQGETFDADEAKDRSFKRYAAYASQMDDAVGRLIETVTELNQLENTIVVFSSDNGAIYDTLHKSDNYPGFQTENPRLGTNLPLRGQKAQLYEGGIRTPTVMMWPGIISPRKERAVMHSVDWMPTFAGLCGYQPPSDPQWDGIDMWPVLSGERRGGDRSLFWNFRGREFGARIGDWKLITDATMSPEGSELYNIAEDPYEVSELSARHPTKMRELLGALAEDRKKDGRSKRPDAPE